MLYISTRGGGEPISFTDAVAQGLAPDGGLYLPQEFPDLRDELDLWQGLSYPELCLSFFKKFATDICVSDLEEAVFKAYEPFSHPQTAPLVQLNENWQVLELFHGLTLYFFDISITLLVNLYMLQIKRGGK